LLPDLSRAETFSTLVHDVAHEALHRTSRRAETTRTIRETEAEAVAFVVSQAALETNGSSAAYIQLWNGDKQTLRNRCISSNIQPPRSSQRSLVANSQELLSPLLALWSLPYAPLRLHK
jgi:hypothetical protein